MKKITDLSDSQKVDLIENRWKSSASVWDTVVKMYDENLKIYKNDPRWLAEIPRKKSKVRANRVFVDMESVINSLIANNPVPTILPGRDTIESKQLATAQEKYFQRKYEERNIKETVRKGLRNLYFGRLIVIKPFWNARINDWDARAIDPRKLRIAKNATKEDDSEFAIEEITDSLVNVLKRFPKKEKEILAKQGFTDDAQVLIMNPDVTYKEAWIRDHVIFKYEDIVLGMIRNPYWDWDGLLVTPQEEEELAGLVGQGRRDRMSQIKIEQSGRQQTVQAAAERAKMEAMGADEAPAPSAQGDMPLLENHDEAQSYQAYYFNHFDQPRKPYIVATIFNNENTPIGQTDMIQQAAPLQENIDERKRDITDNAKIMNGTIYVDSSVMSKDDAQRLRFEAQGVIWGKGVVVGVKRETGTPLPNFVVEDMLDSRREIDNIMAASSAFRGEREGQETKGGRIALVDQSFLRLNELVQVVDYISYELYNWFYQLSKVRYTEHHYAKTMGKDKAMSIITLVQDDFEDGAEVRVIGGKTLPEDRQFKFEQAQKDVEIGLLSPADYFDVAGYDSPQEKAKNRVTYDINPAYAVGLGPEEMQKIAPPSKGEEPSQSISYKDLPPDGKIQLAAKAGLELDPNLVVAKDTKEISQRDRPVPIEKSAPARDQ